MIPNYEHFTKSLSYLYETNNNPYPTYSNINVLNVIKDELNRAFPDFKCTEVIYTPNYDKEFFGIFVLPCGLITNDFIYKLFAGLTMIDYNESFESFKFDSYKLEIDGKLLRDFNFSYHELAALILQEVCAMNSIEPVDRLRNAIDNYICMNNVHLYIKSMIDYWPVFELVGKITLHNITSLFTRFEFSVFDHVSDIVRDGLYEPFKTAWSKLNTMGKMEEVNTNLVMLSWYFESYKDFRNSRQLEFILRSSIETESSAIVKKLSLNALNSVIGDLSCHDNRYYNNLIHESSKRKGLIYQMKRNGLKSIEEDLYEYNMRLRNVETQDDAILLMRQINSRMSILEEYLEEEDMDDKDRKRWESCYNKYTELRDALSKKTVYNRKMYGLFVDYNALQQMNDNGNFMNTYY